MPGIRKAKDKDWDKIWPIIQAVFQGGDTYPYSPETSKEEAYNIWI
jgi:hypothetical protein